jgi:diguanylate cyclase (GGDEF)-like protein
MPVPFAASHLGRASIGAAAIGAIAAISYVDYATGTELRIYPLYFVPMALGAWYLNRASALVLATLCSVGWVLSNHAAGLHYSQAHVWIVNLLSQAFGFLVVGLLVARWRREWERERELGRHDPLTGLLNLRAFHEQAEALVALCRRQNQPITVAYVDVDDFKHVNDRVGHGGGDQVLQFLAGALRTVTRESDLVARMGGDEFVLLLPHTGEDGARALLDRVRAKIAEVMQEAPVPVTVSIGAVAYSTPPAEILEIVRRADALMYRTKASGKDRVELTVATG